MFSGACEPASAKESDGCSDALSALDRESLEAGCSIGVCTLPRPGDCSAAVFTATPATSPTGRSDHAEPGSDPCLGAKGGGDTDLADGSCSAATVGRDTTSSDDWPPPYAPHCAALAPSRLPAGRCPVRCVSAPGEAVIVLAVDPLCRFSAVFEKCTAPTPPAVACWASTAVALSPRAARASSENSVREGSAPPSTSGAVVAGVVRSEKPFAQLEGKP